MTLDLAILTEDWVELALCAQTDPEAFFPEKGGSVREAKAVCQRCPVLDECLTYAVAHQERFGIWGGKSERERRKISHPPPADSRTVHPSHSGVPPMLTAQQRDPEFVSLLRRFPPEDLSHACAGNTAGPFFVPDGVRGAHKDRLEREATQICSTCPVTADCLQYALALNVTHGVFGGMTPEQRASHVRRTKRQQRTTNPIEKEPIMPRTDLRECTNCGDEVASLSSRLWCDGCEDLPAPSALAKVIDTSLLTEDDIAAAQDAPSIDMPASDDLGPAASTVPAATALPDYALQLAELLVETEGHPDPLVRAVRKIVTQSAVALHQAHTTSQNSDPDAKTAAARAISSSAPSSVPASSGSEPTADRKTRAPSAAVQLMRDRGIEANQVRTWAQEQGLEVAARGSIHIDIVSAYVDAHSAAA